MRPLDPARAERWHLTVGNVRDCADRVQATADAFRPETTILTRDDFRALFARHVLALADHAVALNCLLHIAEECLDNNE